MQIIEQYIKGKRPDQRFCEDGWVVTPHFAAVIDGSTSKIAGRQGGLLAMQLVKEALRTLQPQPINKTCCNISPKRWLCTMCLRL